MDRSILIIIIYVDDILVTGSCEAELQKFTNRLNSTFSLKDLGDVDYFLGLEVNRDEIGMFLSQKKYIFDLLELFDMKHCTTCPSPMVGSKQFTSKGEKELKNPTIFRRLIGALQYVTNTQPDITFFMNKLSRYLSKPTVIVAKRVLRYLKGTLDHGIHLKPSHQLNLYGFYDANWGVAHEDRRSISGYCVYLGRSLISWASKR